jgi:Uma2 family endonuclease
MNHLASPKLAETAWPDHTQLPDTDGSIVENFQEHPQSILLTESLWPVLERLHPDGQFAIGQNSGIYWRYTDPPLRGCVAPDWFYVPDVPPMLAGQVRRSYVMWQELIPPLLVVEFCSGDGSEERDRSPNEGKFWIYERRIRPAYYAIYEVDPGRVEVYQLVGRDFQLLAANERGHYPIASLGIELGIWEGTYRNFHLPWLRCWESNGRLLPTDSERAEEEKRRAEEEKRRAEEAHRRAEEEKRRAEEEKRRAEEEKRRAERLAARLRELGVNPDGL